MQSLDYFSRECGDSCSRVAVTGEQTHAFVTDPIAWWANHHRCSEVEVRNWVFDSTADGLDGGDGRYLRCVALTRSGRRCRMAVTDGRMPTFAQWLEHERNGGAYCTVHDQGTPL